jgi:hypothetical protein
MPGWLDGWIVVAVVVLVGGGLLLAHWRRGRRSWLIDPHTGKTRPALSGRRRKA